MDYKLSNDKIEVCFQTHGGEMTSIKKDGNEYLWCGDARYWNRHAPVLFPTVGMVWDKTYRYGGNEYHVGQHGFARDMEFEFGGQTKDTISFVLKDNEKSREMYPFSFELTNTYVLCGNTITVKWAVKNTDDKTLYFSIGGHPAFMCPVEGRGEMSDYRMLLKKAGEPVDAIDVNVISEGGCLGPVVKHMELDAGRLTPSAELFADDALIIENDQADEVALVDPEGCEYLTVRFESPLFGLWSPVGKNAPFVCIEPWYGRCDRVGFAGTLKEREYGNAIEPGQVFEKEFTITL